jgi:hypothetical protein
MSLREFNSSAARGRSVEVASSATLLSRLGSVGSPSRRTARSEQEATSIPRELPDVTGFLVVVLVTLGLFVVPVGATIMQGPAIVASILGK